MHELAQVHVTSAALLPHCLRMPSVQDLFYEDDTVLFIDMHQHEVWPGSGHVNESGRGAGEGFTINVPMPGHPHHRSHAGILNVWSAAHGFEWDVQCERNLCAVPPGQSACLILLSSNAWTGLCPPGPLCASSAAGWERACRDALSLHGWQPVA